jgi:ectoine hydroxylase-related dioxygenase (phytanoyl-CoA dioxygenase family)
MDKGYKILRNQFPKELLKSLVSDVNVLQKELPSCDVFKTEEGKIKQIQNLHLLPKFKSLETFIKDDLGYEGEVLNMQYFIKPPGYKMTSPHQDGAYFEDNDSDILTFWIPLHSVKVDNSCMHYLPWDGKREIKTHVPCGSNVRTRTGKTGYSMFNNEFDLSLYEPVELDLGDAVVHNQFSLHYSSVNKKSFSRVALTCILKLNK